MLTVEAVIILRNEPEQNETVTSHYFMENQTKQLRHIILWRTERNSCVTLFYGEQNKTVASLFYGEQNETVVSHYFMENRTKHLRHIILLENRTKQLHHIILWRTEQNSCVTLFYGEQNETVASHYFMEQSRFLLYYTYMTGMILLQILPCALNCSSC